MSTHIVSHLCPVVKLVNSVPAVLTLVVVPEDFGLEDLLVFEILVMVLDEQVLSGKLISARIFLID